MFHFSKAPNFWYRTPINKIVRAILYPISRIYSFFAERNYNMKEYKYRSAAHVVAIGAITAGGSGKTPVVISLCELLSKLHQKVAVLSKGYGRKSKKNLKVDNQIHTFKDVGDEPLLISQYADVFVAKNRMKSAKMAEENGHNLLILDDGISQRDLYTNEKIVVVDSTQGFGNGEMLPLGPNRLNFDIIKKDVSAVAIIKAFEDEDVKDIIDKIPAEIPKVVGYLQEDFSQFSNEDKFIAFCGIGYPQKFFNSLKKQLNVVEEVEFPDHHPFSDEEIVDLLDEARLKDAKLITTEKDFYRIPRRYHVFISFMSIKIVWKDSAKIAQYLNLQVSQK